MAAPAAAESYPLEEMLKKPGDLEDIAVGQEDAPITVIEYFSMTCSHCAHFPRYDLQISQRKIYRHRQDALHLA